MIWAHLVILLGAIALGARVGGIGIGFAGGLGVLLLGLTGATVSLDDLPLTVVAFIMVVIVAVAAMQVAGGMDYLVDLADRVLRSNPKRLTILGPVVIYLLTLTASTGQASFATMPVIVEVGKENDVRPQRALTIGVAASLVAITASPISASVLFMSSLLEEGETGWDYLLLLAVVMPATLLAVLATSVFYLLWDRARGRTTLSSLPVYAERLGAGTARPPQPHAARDLPPAARRSVVIFVVGLLAVLTYAILTSERVGLLEAPAMNGAAARVAAMLTVALAILVLCRADVQKIPSASTFKVGMTACVCILGVAWLGSTFVNNHTEIIGELAGDALVRLPWLLALVMIIGSSLLYSQAATAQALMPTALALGVAPMALVASFPATSGMFILPTYPTLLAAAELDDTGSTRLGRHVFDHPFLVPGLLVAGLSVALSFLFAGWYGA